MWIVEIDGFSRLGFTTCQVPSFEISTTSYQEGGAHLHPRNIVDQISYQPVTLERGVTNDTSFNKWATGFYDLVTNNVGSSAEGLSFGIPTTSIVSGALNSLGVHGQHVGTYNPGSQYRRKVTIRHTNRVGQTIVTYTLYDAYPTTYKPSSDFNAEDDEGFSIEQIVLSYEAFDVQYSGLAGALATIVRS